MARSAAAQDERVSNRWVVLKGLLNSGDAGAMAVALAERQFLARVEHPNVVRIYNVVQHADADSGGRPLGHVPERGRPSSRWVLGVRPSRVATFMCSSS